MLQKIDAIVLSKLKYGESDLIVKCFTKQRGTETYLLKRILASKKGKLKTAFITPLTQLVVEEHYRENASLQRITEAKPRYTYYTLHTQVTKSAMAMFLGETLSLVLKEEKQNEALYEYLSTTLQLLDQEDAFANFHLLFLVKLTKYIGFYPKVTQENTLFFNISDGHFESVSKGSHSISGDNVFLLKQLLGTNFDEVKEIKINRTRRQAFLSMILHYFEYHVPGFKKPKSLKLVNSLFN